MHRTRPPRPPFRQLRGYAFDPSLSNKIDTASINNIIYKVAWEENLKEGPSGDYIEVVDYDPTVDRFYTPIDLNDPYILAQNGLDPSESNPQFHQQMVYAVAMTTIKNFENAIGRPILWSSRLKRITKTSGKDDKYPGYVKTLRIYPHAFRGANAYYSPQKRALLFGYFSSQPAIPTLQMPETLIFTCLSHDIIAHETTHAILDGIYDNYTEDTNPDVLAFHEAFADIVALFQHFTFPEVLKHQIAKTRGDLASQNLLGQLAQEFGSAIGKYGALRDAIGYMDEETQEWKIKEPDGSEYQTIMEPHARGAILVSAVFDAFLTIYKHRAADLLRIATGGTGILPQGELHPDLVNRLAAEASKSAAHILKMCIRAIDYCPPVDLTFGDYLRAIITADCDLVADDYKNYRLAFIDAFRRRGIFPPGIKSLSVESLRYPVENNEKLDPLFKVLTKFLRQFSGEVIYAAAEESLGDAREMYSKEGSNNYVQSDKKHAPDARERIFNLTTDYIKGKYHGEDTIIEGLHSRIYRNLEGPDFQKITGLVFDQSWRKFGVKTTDTYEKEGPSFWVHSLKLASRVGPSGNKQNQVIISLTQKAGIRIVTNNQKEKDVVTFEPYSKMEQSPDEFIMTGGVTLIFDLDSLKLEYAIRKPLIEWNKDGVAQIHKKRAQQLHDYYSGDHVSEFNACFSMGRHHSGIETFSFLHNH